MPFVDPASAAAAQTLEHVGWVLLHFCWQGALLAALFWFANFCLRRRSAAARYVAGCVTLLAMAAAPVVTFGILHATRDDASLLLRGEHLDRLISMPFFGDDLGATSGAAPAPIGASGTGGAVADTNAARVALWKARLRAIVPWLTVGWIVGVSLMALRQLGGWVWLTYTVRSATLPVRDRRLEDLARRLVRRPVRLLESAMVHAPATLGALRPVVLLPVAALTGLTPRQLEAVMAHELAHIRRWDYVVNAIQSAIEAALFFHPAVWWVSRHVRQEREHSCDDIAAGVVGDRAFYASALERLEHLRPGALPQLALAATGGDLVTRVGRLLGVRPYDLAHVGRGAGVVWAMACGLVLLVGVELLAASSAKRDAAVPAPRLSVASAVYAALNLPREGGGSSAADGGDAEAMAEIPSLAAPPASDDRKRNADADADAALHAFAVKLATGGDPDALARAAFENMRVDSALAYQASPGWRYGSFAQRRAVLLRLLDRARDAGRPSSPDDRAAYARAAVALAAQDAALVGTSGLRAVLDAPAITRAAGLSDAALADVRPVVAQHDAVTRAFGPLLVRARRALAGGSSASGSTRADAAELRAALREMAPLTRGRPDLQWHLANVTWAYQSRAPAAADAFVADVIAAVDSPDFARWMAESRALPPPQIRQVRPITHAELQQMKNLTQSVRDNLSAAPAASAR